MGEAQQPGDGRDTGKLGKPLDDVAADTDNSDDDTPTYFEAGTQHSVDIPRTVAAAVAAAPLFCSSFAVGK